MNSQDSHVSEEYEGFISFCSITISSYLTPFHTSTRSASHLAVVNSQLVTQSMYLGYIALFLRFHWLGAVSKVGGKTIGQGDRLCSLLRYAINRRNVPVYYAERSRKNRLG